MRTIERLEGRVNRTAPKRRKPSTRSAPGWTRLRWGSCISDRLRLDALGRHKDRFEGRLLDVGCGMRPFEPIFGSRVDTWFGVDQQVSCEGPTRADLGTDLNRPLELPDAQFATVLCTQVLEHVTDPELLMGEMARLLAPGGTLLLTAPQTNPLHEAPHDYFRFTAYGLRLLAERAGLEIIAIEPMGGAIATVAQQVVWHLAPLNRVRHVGERLYGAVIAPIQWSALRLDSLAERLGESATETTIGHLLVARRRP